MEIKEVVIKVIPHENHRMPTLGDWWIDEKGILQVRASDIGNWKSEMCLGMHEAAEGISCTAKGITAKEVDEFDEKFESEREQGLHADDDEPGEDPRAPYHDQHLFAEGIDTLFRGNLGVTHKEWNDDFYSLFDRDLAIEHLEDTYITLKPSPIDGVGVFAIRDIPKGISPFLIAREKKNNPSGPVEGYIDLPKEDFKSLPKEVQEHIKTYCTKSNGLYNVPIAGFKIVDMVQFLNDSKTPNIISINDGVRFEAIRDIKTGEELTIDYDTITED